MKTHSTRLYSLKNSLIDEDFEAGDLGQTFESGRNVNRIADHGELHSLFRANVARDGFPVTDPDSGFDGRSLGSGLPDIERLQRVTHAEGGADARSGSSARVIGAPKTAITASPMNLSRVPAG